MDLLISRAMLYFSMGEYEKSVEYIDKCLEIDDTLDELLFLKLTVISALDDEDLLNKTIDELDDTNPEFLHGLLDDRSPMGYDDLPVLYDDGENKVIDVRDSEYSIFGDSDKYVLEEDIRYGRDYPTESLNFNMFNMLTNLKTNSNFKEVYSSIGIVDMYGEEILKEVLLGGDYIAPENCDDMDIKKEASKRSLDELSLLLKKYGITVSGKKKKLVKLAVKHVPADEFVTNYKVTSIGEEFIADYGWFEIYNECLELFEVSDVAKYLNEHEGYDIDLIQDYLTEHIELAHQKDDFDYLIECYNTKTVLYSYAEDYDNCLKESLRSFILSLNPLYLYEIHFAIFLLFNTYIIDYIKDSLEHSDNVDLKSLFYELWDEKDSEDDYCPKDVGFNYLNRALDGEDLYDLSVEYKEKYIDTFE